VVDMPAEQLCGARPGPSADVFALGVSLYEALTGENLFFGRSVKAVLEAIRQSRVPDVREMVPDCPPALAEFFALNLDRDKERRMQDGREYHRRLRRIYRAFGSQPGV